MTPNHAEPDLIFKVADSQSFAAAAGSGQFAGMPVDLADGYIHFSTAGQLRETLAKHFKGQGDLTLAAIRRADIAQHLRWEPSRGGALFPHLYAPLPLNAVVHQAPIAVAADGSVALPEWVR